MNPGRHRRVLEGSTPGGRLLGSHFADEFQLSEGPAFFDSDGARRGAMGKAFCQMLDDHSHPDTDDEVVRSALQTFASMSQWLA